MERARGRERSGKVKSGSAVAGVGVFGREKRIGGRGRGLAGDAVVVLRRRAVVVAVVAGTLGVCFKGPPKLRLPKSSRLSKVSSSSLSLSSSR